VPRAKYYFFFVPGNQPIVVSKPDANPEINKIGIEDTSPKCSPAAAALLGFIAPAINPPRSRQANQRTNVQPHATIIRTPVFREEPELDNALCGAPHCGHIGAVS
jgi:hypothetical protein